MSIDLAKLAYRYQIGAIRDDSSEAAWFPVEMEQLHVEVGHPRSDPLNRDRSTERF